MVMTLRAERHVGEVGEAPRQNVPRTLHPSLGIDFIVKSCWGILAGRWLAPPADSALCSKYCLSGGDCCTGGLTASGSGVPS